MPAHLLTPDVSPGAGRKQKWSVECDECGATAAGDSHQLQHEQGWGWTYSYNEETGEVRDSSATCRGCSSEDAPERNEKENPLREQKLTEFEATNGGAE